MGKRVTFRWRVLATLVSLVAGLLPAYAAEDSLNGFTLNTTFREVLGDNNQCMPHFIGPTLENVTDVTNILKIPPLPLSFFTMGSSSMPGGPGMAGGPMGAPMGAPMGGPAMPGVVPFAGGGTGKEMVLKGRTDFIVWMYAGEPNGEPNLDAGYFTYVVFDKEGQVIEVIVWLTDTTRTRMPSVSPPRQNIPLGSGMADLINSYGYPQNLARIGSQIVFSYPSVTYSLDAGTKKVIGIAIGSMPLTAIQLEPKVEPTYNGGMAPYNGSMPPTGMVPTGGPYGSPTGQYTMPGNYNVPTYQK